MLHLYRRLLALRRSSPALALGALTLLNGPEGTVVYERTGGGERWRVLVNFGDEPVEVAADGRVAIASDGADEGARWSGTLGRRTPSCSHSTREGRGAQMIGL
jgi:glycosidase